MPPTIETSRLWLAALDTTHIEEVHELFSAPGHTIGVGPIADRDVTWAWLERRHESYTGQGLAWYGLWYLGREFVGTCGLFRGSRCGSDPEIGYEVALRLRGRGIAREAAAAVTWAGHRADLGPIWATIRLRNTASRRIIESLDYDHVRTESDRKGPLLYYRHGTLPS